MDKIFNLVVQDKNETSASFVAVFKVRDDIQLPEYALRDAVKEFICSDSDGAKQALKESCGCFGWGDALANVPADLLEKHGLTRLEQNAIDGFVDYYEALYEKSLYGVEES